MLKSFNIIICGAGLAGLGAAIAIRRKGHKVLVLESAAQLNGIGAEIQIPPKSTRILESYGLKERFLEKVVWPESMQLRRYATGGVISVTPLDPIMTNAYGHP
jgi:salicylate hydroxylase